MFYLIGLGGGLKTSTHNFEINYANLCKCIQILQEVLHGGCNIKLCNQLLFSNQLQKCCWANHGYCYMRDMMKHDLWLAELQFCNWLLNSNWLQSFMLHPHVLLYFLAEFDCLFYLTGLGGRFKTSTQNFEIHELLSMQIYSKSTKNATCLFLGRFQFCLFYLIGLGGGFKTSTQNFEIHELCKFIKINKNTTSLLFLGQFWCCLFYLIGLGGGLKTSTHNFEIN